MTAEPETIKVDAVVQWYDPGRRYGFVTTPRLEGDVFVHASVLNAAGLADLAPGESVSCIVGPDPRNRGRWRVQRILVSAVNGRTPRSAEAIGLDGTGSQDLELLQTFLTEEVEAAALPIGAYLPRLGPEPFFLVAATGVGKTVAVPLHLYIQLATRVGGRGQGQLPRVYVVEPTIPLCRREAEHMNATFRRFLDRNGVRQFKELPFGYITGAGKGNPGAVVLFVTTGVFELIASGSEYDPSRVRFVIDEAHRILGQHEGVEIAAAIARSRGAPVDFMSATVDISTLERELRVAVVEATQERFPVVKVATEMPMEACVADLAFACLLDPERAPIPKPVGFSRPEDQARCQRLQMHLLSRREFVDPVDERSYPGLDERPQGLLAIVNSHRGEQADTKRIADRLRDRCAGRPIEILRLASAVERDTDQRRSFEQRVAAIEERNGRYIIVATSVVEMGLTFPSLDYVVTMDTELETAEAYGGAVIRERPLGVNAFFQRIGRVGRRRPGLAFVTREVTHGDRNPAWSAWPADRLARELKVEPIAFAIGRSDLQELALYLYQNEVEANAEAVRNFLDGWRLPSRPEVSPQLMARLIQQRDSIRRAQLSDDGVRFNRLGRQFRDIRMVRDLELGRLLAHCSLHEELPLAAVAAVGAAAEGLAIADFLGRGMHLDDTPILELRKAFPRDEFKISLEEVHARLIGPRPRMTAVDLDTSETTAHRIAELLRRGWQVREPLALRATGAVSKEAQFLEFTRPAVILDRRSEVLSIYSIVKYFLDRYWSDREDPTLAEFERERARRALRNECIALGLEASRVQTLLVRAAQILEAAKVTIRRPNATDEIGNEEAALAQALELAVEVDAGSGRIDKVERVSRLGLIRAGFKDRRLWPVDFTRQAADIERTMRGRRRGRRPIILPEVGREHADQFVEVVHTLGLFTDCAFTLETDQRAKNWWIGSVTHHGQLVQTRLDPGRTSLRPGATTWRGRARVMPRPFIDDAGVEAVRYTLTHLTLAT